MLRWILNHISQKGLLVGPHFWKLFSWRHRVSISQLVFPASNPRSYLALSFCSFHRVLLSCLSDSDYKISFVIPFSGLPQVPSSQFIECVALVSSHPVRQPGQLWCTLWFLCGMLLAPGFLHLSFQLMSDSALSGLLIVPSASKRDDTPILLGD